MLFQQASVPVEHMISIMDNSGLLIPEIDFLHPGFLPFPGFLPRGYKESLQSMQETLAKHGIIPSPKT